MSNLDPALAQAISIVAGAVAMAIISAASYYWPKGKDRFDENDHDEDNDIDGHNRVHNGTPDEAGEHDDPHRR